MKKRSLMKRMIVAGLAAAVITVGGGIMDTQTTYAKATFDVFDFEPHRGGRDARPENTLYSYAYAMEMGATSIECDMQLTKDGHIVMSHNPILNHDITRDKKGKYVEPGKYDIRTMTLKEVQQFDVGVMDPNCGEYYQGHGATQYAYPTHIPTLEEVFQLINEYGDKKVMLNIETKTYPDPAIPDFQKHSPDPKKFVQVFNDLVKKYNMEDRVVMQSFDWRTLIEMKKLNPNISLSALWCQQPTWGRDSENLRPYEPGPSPWLGGLDIDDPQFKGNPVLAAHSIGVDVISPYYTEISQEDVQLAHSLGMKVVPWTVNDERDIEMMLDMGVDGMISDKPWILRAALEKRGVELRQPTVNVNSKYHTGTAHKNVKTEKLAGGMDAAY